MDDWRGLDPLAVAQEEAATRRAEEELAESSSWSSYGNGAAMQLDWED
ncbi:hypothetical protein [Streptomyces viridochromogenes]|nr:hypothetical protein [Streptomyces viridochromogenes]